MQHNRWPQTSRQEASSSDEKNSERVPKNSRKVKGTIAQRAAPGSLALRSRQFRVRVSLKIWPGRTQQFQEVFEYKELLPSKTFHLLTAHGPLLTSFVFALPGLTPVLL
jgi:hypothetical protein